MKVSHKISLISAIILMTVISILSWSQYISVRNSLFEKTENNINEVSTALAFQISNWLNAKLSQIELMAPKH